MEVKEYIFKILRFDPEQDNIPSFKKYTISIQTGVRVLDGLIKIKEEQDGTLTFRRSCAHGICGSCAMKINGINRLACQTLLKDMKRTIVVEPIPSFRVIKDLVVDLSPFFEKIEEVIPFLVNDEPIPPGDKERIQSPQEHHKILDAVTCILCASCTSSCPSYRVDKQYLGPAALLKAYRFIFDSRDRATDKRFDIINRTDGLWRCHTVFNCTDVCPKAIEITKHILQLKRLALKKSVF
jgi:succinate dehydrogenase / fumarate reductase iron-sulfur subunit